jgi:DNA ligase (NAD+)
MSHAAEIKELEYVIPILDTLYEQGDDCVHPITGKIVTDPEYDAMRARLAFLSPKSPVLKDVTASQVVSAVRKVTHRPPMTSIHKAIGTLDDRKKELERWKRDVLKELHYTTPIEKWACQAYKLDGTACALYYEKGKLVAAGLRPRDGVAGEDVTENIKFVSGVKVQLPEPITCTIRGEIICKLSDFEAVKKDWQNPKYDLDTEPKNPRNYATGSIRQFKNPAITKERRLSFIGYAIYGDDIKVKDEVKLAKWVNVELGIPYVRTTPFGYTDDSLKREWTLKDFEDNVPELDYQVDGVIISVRNIDDREQMGHHGGAVTNPPKGRLAWKFEEEHADVPLTNDPWAIWNTGRTGAIVPVLQFDGVQLAGTTVTQCTGHNLGYLLRNKIGKGTIVRIIKSGNIIPKIIGVISGHTTPDYPKHCPVCGQETEVVEGDDADMKELMCLNVSCGARAVSTIVHYLSTLGVKGLSDSTIQKLYNAGFVKNPADLYELTEEKLLKADFSDRQAALTIARIHMVDKAEQYDDLPLARLMKQAVSQKKVVPIQTLFAALGIEGAGKTAGRELASAFGSFQAIAQGTEDQFAKVDGIGRKTAGVIADFFKHNMLLVGRLLRHVEPELPKVGKLTGTTFCFTGGFPEGKSYWEKKVEEQGGKIASSVSKKVNFVVVGSDAGSKEKKADELGVKKLSLDDLKKML